MELSKLGLDLRPLSIASCHPTRSLQPNSLDWIINKRSQHLEGAHTWSSQQVSRETTTWQHASNFSEFERALGFGHEFKKFCSLCGARNKRTHPMKSRSQANRSQLVTQTQSH